MYVVIDAWADTLTSCESTINFTRSALSEMRSVVATARDDIVSGRLKVLGSTWFVGRFMEAFWRDRFLNFHGQYGARLSRKQSIHENGKHSRSTLFKILSPILFSSPNVRLRTMTELWPDKFVIKDQWGDFFKELNEEWQGHAVYASILLAVNTGFLAIPLNDHGDVHSRSAKQIASYVSVANGLSSMLLALLLYRQHRTRERGSARESSTFLGKRHHPKHGLETLAIVYSLPYAMLMWGMVTFILAFLIMCFDTSTTPARCVVGVVFLFNAVLVAWCICVSWEKSETLGWWKDQLLAQTRMVTEAVDWRGFLRHLWPHQRREPPEVVPGA